MRATILAATVSSLLTLCICALVADLILGLAGPDSPEQDCPAVVLVQIPGPGARWDDPLFTPSNALERK